MTGRFCRGTTSGRRLFTLQHELPHVELLAGPVGMRGAATLWARPSLRRTVPFAFGLQVDTRLLHLHQPHHKRFRARRIARQRGFWGQQVFEKERRRRRSPPRLASDAVRGRREDPVTLFEATWAKEHGGFEWCDSEGTRVAMEEDLQDSKKLVVCKALKRQMLDVLVATWCMRIWHDSAESLGKRAADEGSEAVSGGLASLREVFFTDDGP